MRIVIQRVSEASVFVDDEVIAQIGAGLCVLLGVSKTDDKEKTQALAEKTKNLRIFADTEGKLNRSVVDAGGEILVVSQFTLYGDMRKGNRPSFTEAAEPARADSLYQHFVSYLRRTGLAVSTGRFRSHMRVSLVNDGPVTLILES